MIRAPNTCQCIPVHIFFVSCSGVSDDHITTVSILSTCNYGNNCRGFSLAMSWCQNATTTGLPNLRFTTNQLNIINASTSDNGVYQCCSVAACCSAGDDDILDSTLNITVFSESVKVARALAVFCVQSSLVICCACLRSLCMLRDVFATDTCMSWYVSTKGIDPFQASPLPLLQSLNCCSMRSCVLVQSFAVFIYHREAVKVVNFFRFYTAVLTTIVHNINILAVSFHLQYQHILCGNGQWKNILTHFGKYFTISLI